jgi:general secretion pathway protein E
VTRLNDRKRNIMTVEDPIEYYLDGISQTQVNTKVEMTFARGLRAILRQDPDVVMVGEIRDSGDRRNRGASFAHRSSGAFDSAY